MRARQIIFEQQAPLGVRRSAWVLYQHECTRTNPVTGRPFSSRKALANVIQWITEQNRRRTQKRPTPTQRLILHMLVIDGLNQKEIAYQLQRNRLTIMRHLSRLQNKLGLKSLSQVVAVAIKQGWIDAPKMD